MLRLPLKISVQHVISILMNNSVTLQGKDETNISVSAPTYMRTHTKKKTHKNEGAKQGKRKKNATSEKNKDAYLKNEDANKQKQIGNFFEELYAKKLATAITIYLCMYVSMSVI